MYQVPLSTFCVLSALSLDALCNGGEPPVMVYDLGTGASPRNVVVGRHALGSSSRHRLCRSTARLSAWRAEWKTASTRGRAANNADIDKPGVVSACES